MTKVPYETQMRDCLLDFVSMVENELIYVQTGRHPGGHEAKMSSCRGQWAALARDARLILNREDNSYGRKA